MEHTNVLRPVVLRLEPLLSSHLAKAEIREHTSLLARDALKKSAAAAGLSLTESLEFDDYGAPIAQNGVHWSITHSGAFAAAIAAPFLIGIDLEIKRASLNPALLPRTLSQDEQGQRGNDSQRLGMSLVDLLLTYWTIKEAATKATGQGFKDFKKCSIGSIERIDANTLISNVSYTMESQNQWNVLTRMEDRWICSIAFPRHTSDLSAEHHNLQNMAHRVMWIS